MRKKQVKRGDLYFYDYGDNAGSIQCGERPVLVLQADDFNENAPTIIVAAVTSVAKKRYLPSHILLGQDFGLKKPSMLLVEQIRAINKSDLKNYIGRLDDEMLWSQINKVLKKTFGLWIYKKVKESDIRCLCPKCLNDYMQSQKYFIRRVDPFAKVKSKCDKCDKLGWDYTITEK